MPITKRLANAVIFRKLE